jgi:amino acid transporter
MERLSKISTVGQLRSGVLGLGGTFAQSFALLALALGSATGTSVVAAFAGGSVPLVYVLGGIVSLCLAAVIIRFTRRMASAGGLYTFTSRGLGPDAGFMGGWLYFMGFAAGISFVMVISALYLSQVFEKHAHIGLGWFPAFLIEIALLTALALIDIRISARTQLIVAGLGALAILIGMLITLGKGGAEGFTFTSLSPGHIPSVSGFFHGLVFAFGAFIGFEAAAAMGEESKEPLKMIPRAVLTAVLVGLVFYLFVTFSLSVGFGIHHIGDWAKNPTAYDTIVTKYSGSSLAVIVDIAVALDAFVASLAATVLVSRTVYAMGREGGLPKSFAWTHPRFRTPWVGILSSIGLTVVLVVWLARLTYDPYTYFGLMATAATFWLLGTYILVAGAGMVYFARNRNLAGTKYSPLFDLAAPVIAIAICALTIYYSIEPQPPAPFNHAQWISLGWFLLGLVALALLRVRSPQSVAAFGCTLAEDHTAEHQPVAAPPAPIEA